MAPKMSIPTAEARSMTNGLNGNGSHSASASVAGDGVAVTTSIDGGMYASSSVVGTGGGVHAASSFGTSLGQQHNINTHMNNMNMLEAGNQFHHHALEEDFIAVSSEDGVDSDSGSDYGDDDQAEIVDYNPSGSRRKKYHRHTPEQILAMENFFKECPHPDDKQRKQLGSVLGLEPLQVKFWFQNKRTQLKAKKERHENEQLRNENNRLKVERMNLQEAIRNNMTCRTCRRQKVVDNTCIEEQLLKMENEHLRQEINRISEIAKRFLGRPFLTFPDGVPMLVPSSGGANLSEEPVVSEIQESGDVFRAVTGSSSEADKPIIFELVAMAMNEVVTLATTEPLNLWVTSIDGTTAMLNYQTYFAMFTPSIGLPPPEFKFESSRATALVKMDHVSLVQMFMNVNQWSTIFGSTISRAQTVEVLVGGVDGTLSGAVHLMVAEFQLPTPVVPTRSAYFARCCKKHADGFWSIADVSIGSSQLTPLTRFRRRPSGCVIQAVDNGFSMVTWIEHVEVDDSFVHQLYKPLVSSTLAFGAQRWLGTLARQCERLESISAPIPANQLANMGISNQEGKRSVLRLAARLVKCYNQGVSSSTGNAWTILAGSGADDVRVMSRKIFGEPGRLTGIVLCASTCFWIPVPPKTVLNFFCNVSTRGKWDILCNGGRAEEIMHLATGRKANNSVSLFRVTGTTDGTRENMLILQEANTDALGSYVVFAPLDASMIQGVLAGEDSNGVPILPSGVSILPDGTIGLSDAGDSDINAAGGSLLTVAFQILVDSDPNERIALGAITTINGLMTCTVDRIKAYVTGNGGNNNDFAVVNNANMVHNNGGANAADGH